MKQNQNENQISVHVRLSGDDYERLSELAEDIGCGKATALRALLRKHGRERTQVAREPCDG